MNHVMCGRIYPGPTSTIEAVLFDAYTCYLRYTLKFDPVDASYGWFCLSMEKE